MCAEPVEITQILDRVNRGEPRAIDQLFDILYEELRQHAERLMFDERVSHTLQRTALVNEAYVKLFGTDVRYQNRLHFFNAAALAMRRVLLDHAAAKAA